MIEYEDPAVGRMYGKVSYQYMSAMSPTGGLRRQNLHRQAKLIESLANLSKIVKQMREPRPKRVLGLDAIPIYERLWCSF